MKIGIHAFLALAVMALSSTASFAAPTAPEPKPVVKGMPKGTQKSVTLRCPATTDDGSGLPALNITPVNIPAGWRAGSLTAIRLMSATVADGKITCAYGGLNGQPAIRTSRAIPAGWMNCAAQADKTISCVY